MLRLVNPFEIAVALAALIAGARGLIQDQQATGVLADLWPGWGIALYFVGLFLGGLAVLCGAALSLRRKTKSRIQLWRLGLLAIAVAWGTYGLALLVASTAVTGGGAVILLIVALAALYRWFQLRG